MDIAGFLRRYPPFDGLEGERLEAVARSVEIEHFPAGSLILDQSGPPPRFLYVIRKGAVEMRSREVVLDLLVEGEPFGQFSLLAHEGPLVTLIAHEDTICYLVPEALAVDVLETDAGRSFLTRTMRGFIRATRSHVAQEPPDSRYRPVGALVRREPVMIDPDVAVADAAATMARERVSSLLVPMRGGFGILTDRDLRTRVVAVRGAYDVPVETVATFPAEVLPASTLAGEALLSMFARGVHHFPVTDGAGRIVGVVTDSDLMGIGRHTPFAIRSAIDRARSPGEVVGAGRQLPEVVVALVDASADPVDVGRVIALVIDAMTRRLIDLAIERLGDPPAPWAWLALGSGARHEQGLLTDQDHALAYDPLGQPMDLVDPYFASVAEVVTAGLEDAGIPRCRGDAMAVHPKMRAPLDTWVQRFYGWMDDPTIEGTLMSSIGFDFRDVAGPLDAAPVLSRVLLEARSRPRFIKLMGRGALTLHPPTGFFRDLVVEAKGEHAGRLDVKHGGITIVNNLARAWAIRAGSTEKATLARLRAAADAEVVEQEGTDELSEAFRYLWEIRLRHQADQVRAGAAPDDFVDPASIGAFARTGLKEAFRVIIRAQRTLALDFGLQAR